MDIQSYMKKSGSQQNFDKKPPTMARGFVGNGATRSVGPSFSAQSRSTSSTSVGSPSSRSEAAMSSRGRDGSFLGMEMDSLDVQADDAGSQGIVGTVKKKRAQRAVGGDKSTRGLRQFSMRVCEKVEEKRRTTYNEVADELVAEFQIPNSSSSSPDKQPYDEKNIRRRVYDALNVLMAMDIISKDKKDIQWRGLPQTTLNDIETLKTQRDDYQNRIEKKAAYLQELQEQHLGLQNLIKRNEQLYGSGNTPSGGVALPFIMVQTRPHATVELEISEDMQLVHFDFNSTPFELHDDSHVLRAMNLCGRAENPHNDAQNTPITNGEGERSIVQRNLGRPPAVPGILKGGRSMHNR